MRKISFLLIVVIMNLLCPIKASATQWVRVISTDKIVIYIDIDSIKTEGNQRQFWRKDMYFDIQQSTDKDIITLKRFSNVNCSSRKVGTIRAIGYNATDSVIFDTRASPYSTFRIVETIPGKLSDSIVSFVCKRKL